ncbi:MAG: hypothetical protein NTX50_31200 [Candidatus Sumerlaeota bacterium]|nr:hypothetical protein [Candidatus Sumerlaeota bacterium]
MGYSLQALIGNTKAIAELSALYKNAKVVELPQNISMIPMTETFINKLKQICNISYTNFDQLIQFIEDAIAGSTDDKIGYIYIDYFGGDGSKMGIIWEKQKRIFQSEGHEVANEMLRLFGVIKKKGYDEFDTIDLGRCRHTGEWIKQLPIPKTDLH